ncbi:hypothetical protein MCEMIE11_01243 [Burkholderiales bacterium]|jgi:hypothetical protein
MWLDAFLYFGLILLLPFVGWRLLVARLARRGLLIEEHRRERHTNQ